MRNFRNDAVVVAMHLIRNVIVKLQMLPKAILLLVSVAMAAPCVGRPEVREVASLRELMEAASGSGITIRMKPGTYPLTDYIPLSSIAERRKRKEFPFLVFSGNNNRYQMKGVVLELDTALRAALRPPVHTNEIIIAGSGNTMEGLEIRCIGDGTSAGGALVSIQGPGNTLRDCFFHVQGSRPYAYGDLFGKGGPDIIGHHKHSGVQIVASNTRLIGCRIRMRAFGHGFYMQREAHDIRFENCSVEGEMRTTDDMLAETEGPAFDVDFRTTAINRKGKARVMPGYIKSLAEDGFRTYDENRNVVFINCTATNMRGGFELRTKGGVTLENCSVIGCERGFWVSDHAVVRNCRGDAKFGPLLFAEGSKAVVELELLPDESDRKVHALATIHGSGNKVTLKASAKGERKTPLPILIGYGTPSAGEGMSPIPERKAKATHLHNETSMPVVVGKMAEDSHVSSRGHIKHDSERITTR